MTEKQYGGSTGRGSDKKTPSRKKIMPEKIDKNKNISRASKSQREENSPETKKIIEAGQIAKQVREWIKPQIREGTPLIEIAEKIENKIIGLGGKPAFPVNLSINNIAAHYTPSHDDETLAQGILKVDFGVHIDGWTADNAFSMDLENSEENKKLIKASETALEKAIDLIKKKAGQEITTSEIGPIIQEAIESQDFSPVINLTGHKMDQYELHAGTSIPNVIDVRSQEITDGIYAIEPFATTGSGRVKDGKPSSIYEVISERNIRSQIAREIFEFIIEEYQTLPFCSRWLVKKFGSRALLGLKQLEDNGNLHQFNQLVETKDSKVSQAEQTILIQEGKVIVTTN